MGKLIDSTNFLFLTKISSVEPPPKSKNESIFFGNGINNSQIAHVGFGFTGNDLQLDAGFCLMASASSAPFVALRMAAVPTAKIR